MMKKYIATPVDDDDIVHFGEGDTPDEAFNDFISSGAADSYCDYREIDSEIDVYIYD